MALNSWYLEISHDETWQFLHHENLQMLQITDFPTLASQKASISSISLEKFKVFSYSIHHYAFHILFSDISAMFCSWLYFGHNILFLGSL